MAKLSTEKRKQLPDSAFGIPEKRMYPLYKLDEKDNLVPDKAHIESAVKLFGHASDADKPKLARNILKAAHEADMDTSGWDKVNAWAKKESTKKNESKTVTEQSVAAHEYNKGHKVVTEFWARHVKVGNDMLIASDDFQTFAEETHLDRDETSFTLESDVPKYYDQMLREKGFENDGVLATPETRIIMNQFLLEYQFDPETNTVDNGFGDRVPVSLVDGTSRATQDAFD